MYSFFVGLLVLILIAAFSIAGILLFPLLLLLTLVLRIVLGFLLTILVIWLIGKLTLITISYLRQKFGK